MDQYSSSQIVDVQFKLFSENEAKKLSVLPITNVQTFDPLGHPYDNSLADTALGPLKRNDFCKTCGLTDQECLGHFGHIQLPLPVFNPFLLKQLSQILKMFCFQCHHLLLTSFNLEIYIAQLRSLNLGLDYILDDILQYANEISQSAKGIDWNTYEGKMFLRSKLNEFINRECKKTIQKQKQQQQIDNNVAILESVEIVNSKNVIEKKQHLFKDLFGCKLIKPTRVCFHCNSRKRALNVINKSLIIMTASAKKTAIRNFPDSKKSKDVEEDDNDDFDSQQLHSLEMKGKSYLTPSQAREHLRKLWSNEKEILLRLFPFLNIETDDNINLDDNTNGCPIDVFFWQNIIVSPNRFRPLRHMNGRSFEHYKTAALNELMLVAKSLEFALENAKKKNSGDNIARFHHQWQRLQILCNRIYDSRMDNLPDNKAVGVKQILEKKEGLMRKNMMGKRVNFAARSVISPDPYIMADEIGIPVIFATKLSYPQPVTHWNVKQLQEMILNGPNQHPGALSITHEDGYTVRLKPDDIAQRRSIAATIHPPSFNRGLNGVKIVNRHLISGDVLLLNRQPTLHKPSIMAHKARVLPKEKTLRLHYANCKCYNADFDGDEMNAHFPQSELARAEAYNIASVNYQFLVPKDGSPLSGLIQDHIVAGVLMSTRGRFFNKKDYQELIYGALSFLNKPIKYFPPTILKPELLWSGKQIISTLLLNLIPTGKPLPTFEIESKFSAKWLTKEKPREWTAGGSLKEKEMCESQIIFRNGELLSGIMDKVSFGANKNGLIHVCYELYGGDIHSKLLTALARLCTNFLQTHHGFTLGIHDILVKPKIDSKRKKFIKQSKTIGLNTVLETFAIDLDQEKIDEEFAEQIVREELQKAHLDQTDKLMKDLDGAYRIQTNKICDQIREICIPKGLVKLFPENNLQMMIQSGAKGGLPNSIQISCLLGQIELEGRRIPLMMSGRTLPSFQPYESEPRAGGFVTGRFLTGIRPQEFFFHCMAGREGLIDTAVKTSRSGYLQRCLIKHLEGLIVNYDLTVRDSEGSVVQWLYGEDGLDILKCQSLKKSFFPIIYNNQQTLKPNKDEVEKLKSIVDSNLSEKLQKTRKYLKSIEQIDGKSRNKNNSIFLNFEFQQKTIGNSDLTKDDLKKIWLDLDKNSKQVYQKQIFKTLDPIIPKYRPDLNIGAISEYLDQIIDDYMTKDLKNSSKNSLKDFRQIIDIRYMKSLCEPGEAVGLLAAQSIGEPSTQMTLNTFHFAGRGEMNVTLGVPRLRELLMTASSNISTPSMRIPFLAEINDSNLNLEMEAEKVRLKMNAVRLKDVLEQVHIQEMIEINSELAYGGRSRIYDIRFEFLPKSYYKHRSFTNPAKILHFMETNFIRKFCESLNRQLRLLTKSYGLFDTKNVSRSISNRTTKKKVIIDGDEEEVFANDAEENANDENDKNKINKKSLIDDDEDEDLDDYDVDEGEGDTTAMKQRSRINQEQEYEEPEQDEIEMNADNDNDDYFNDDEQSNDGNDKDDDYDDDELSKNLVKSIKKELVEDSIEEPVVIDQTTIMASNGEEQQISSEKTKTLEANLDSRRKRVLNNGSGIVIDYNFDCKRELWCEFKLKFPLIAAKLDFKTILEEEANRAFVHRVGKIDRAFLVEDNDASKRGAKFKKMILTEGVSIPQVVEFERYLDIKRIYSNDMHAIARTYGIEAARAALIREIKDVFGVYGISVDGRHLSLIADHMTFTGTIKGMNRGAMDGISPLQAMTFETTTNFLKNSLLLDLKDDLQSPSSRIVIGRPTVLGTGLFETRLNYKMVSDLAQSTLQLNKSLFKNRSITTTTDLDRSTNDADDTDGNIEQKSSFLSPSMLMPLSLSSKNKKRKRINETDEDEDNDGDQESRIKDNENHDDDNIKIKDEIISDVEDFNDISQQLSSTIKSKSKKRIKLEFD